MTGAEKLRFYRDEQNRAMEQVRRLREGNYKRFEEGPNGERLDITDAYIFQEQQLANRMGQLIDAHERDNC